MKRTAASIALLFSGLIGSALWADGGGTGTAHFLKMGANARAAALGDAHVAVANDASAVYWNPAGLIYIPNKSLSLMHVSHLESTSYDFAAYGQRLGFRSAIGVSVQRFSSGEIIERDATAASVGEFSPTDSAFALSGAVRYPNFSAGASVKLVRSTLLKTAQTPALDMGFLSRYVLNNRVKFGVSVSNIGGKLKFEREEEELPLTIRAGALAKVKQGWFVTLDEHWTKDGTSSIAMGTEYDLAHGKPTGIVLRGGFNTRETGNLSGLVGLTGGMGFRWRNNELAYAFVPFGDLGSSHRFSLSFQFFGRSKSK